MNNFLQNFMVIILLFGVFGNADAQKKNREVVKIKTSAVCNNCKNRIEQNIAFEKGVTDVVVDLATKIATVTFNPKKTNPDKLRQAISKLGYDADDIPAVVNSNEKPVMNVSKP
jgi:periplasmic mercuric ion binding protein